MQDNGSRHLEKSKNCDISTAVHATSKKFWHNDVVLHS